MPSARDGLTYMFDQLEPDAQATLHYLAQRLLDGQKAYGKLDLRTDPRDWEQERKEEIADLLVYTAFQTLKQEMRVLAERPVPRAVPNVGGIDPEKFTGFGFDIKRGVDANGSPVLMGEWRVSDEDRFAFEVLRAGVLNAIGEAEGETLDARLRRSVEAAKLVAPIELGSFAHCADEAEPPLTADACETDSPSRASKPCAT
jgi:hypothetical protein